jgi:hypothetical protein
MPQLYVKTISNRKQPYNYEEDYIVKNIKEVIEAKEGISQDQFKLIFGGKTLSEETRIKDTGIKPGDVIHMIAQLRG